MKKKILAALLCAAMVFSLTGCRNGESGDNDDDDNDRPGISEKDKNSGSKKPSKDSGSKSKDKIDWDSVPYADEKDFEVVSMGYMDNFGVPELTDTFGISKYNGKEKIIKIPEVIDGKPVTALAGFEGSVFQGVSGLRIKTPGSLVQINDGFDGCDDLVLTLDTPKYYTGIKENPLAFFENAFKNCKGVKMDMSMVGVGEFNENAFSGSSGVDITFPQSVDSLSPLAFGEEIAPDNKIQYNGNTYDASNFAELYEFANFSTGSMKIYRDLLDIEYLTAVSPKISGTFNIPDNVWGINDYAFMWCKDITNIVLHGNVNRISENAFAGYDGTVTYNGKSYPASEFNLEEAMSAPSEPKPLTDWESVDYAPESDFEYVIRSVFLHGSFAVINKYTGNAKKIKIPETIEGVQVVGLRGDDGYSSCVFNKQPDLEIMLPKGLEFMDDTFFICKNTRVYFPETEKRIAKEDVEAIFENDVSIVYKGEVYDKEHKEDFMSLYYNNGQ